MSNGHINGNNKYSQNYKNPRNDYHSFNQIEQNISRQGQQFPQQKRYSYDKKKVPNNYWQHNDKELKQKYNFDTQNFINDIKGSKSISTKSDENYNDKIKNEILKENKKLKESIQELKNNNKAYMKILEDKEKKIEKIKKENEKLKKDRDTLRNLNKNIIHYKGSISISPEGKYIYIPKNNQSNKLEDIERREKELNEREKEFNKKMNFLEDKENQIEKEKNELLKLKQKNSQLDSSSQSQSTVQSSINGSQVVKIRPLDSYKSPTLIGLNNIGALYIMNSFLQCLSQTKQLTNYFLDEKNKEKIFKNNIALNNNNTFQLSPFYYELVQKLWDKNGSKSYSPDKIKNIIEQMNPSFKAGQAINAKDFIDFILMKLHQELYKITNSNQNIEPFDPYNQQSSLMHSINKSKRQGSIITDVFTGYYEETNLCLYCKNLYNSRNQNPPIKYSYKMFNCLDFPLEEIKTMKNDSFKNQNISINNNRISLFECFFYDQSSFISEGKKNKICPMCQQISDSMFTKKLFISPNILILILNREQGNKSDVKLDYSETIDITQFVIYKDVPQIIYNLYGVIAQTGQSGSNTHFVDPRGGGAGPQKVCRRQRQQAGGAHPRKGASAPDRLHTGRLLANRHEKEAAHFPRRNRAFVRLHIRKRGAEGSAGVRKTGRPHPRL